MDQPTSPSSHLSRVPRRRGGLLRNIAAIAAGFGLVIVLAAGLLALRLIAGPVQFEALAERVAGAIAARMGEGWTVSLRGASVELAGGSLQLRTTGLDLRNPQGALVVRAPQALVGVDPLSVLSGEMQARTIEFRDLQLQAQIMPDGAIAFAPAEEGAAPDAAPVTTGPLAREDGPAGPSAIAAATGALFGLILEPSGLVGALDRASLTGARLTLLDAERRERAVFSRVDATFARAPAGGRFDLALQGSEGQWRVGGAVTEAEGGRSGVVEAHEVPVRDLLLLSGLSGLPASADLKLSARAEASLRAGRLDRLKVSLGSGAGAILLEDPDMPRVAVEALQAEAAWDEESRSFAIEQASFRAGETRIGLSGKLTLPRGEDGWALELGGRDAVLDGAADGDEPVRLDRISARLAGRPGGVVLEQAALQGPTLTVAGRGEFGVDPKEGLKLSLRSDRLDVRSAIRLWPAAVAAKARRYLLPNLRQGTAVNAALDVAMTVEDMRNSVANRPIPDEAVRMAFVINGGVITVAEGLPPLGPGDVSGQMTGTRLEFRATRARVEMPDGRQLSLPEASFVVPVLGTTDIVAEIGVQAQGGVDALVSLLQSPVLREQAAIDLDPGAVKGRADLRLSLPLALNRMPSLADLPVLVTGSLGDVSLDKPLGRERLENANLALRYAEGALTLRGPARLGGAPAVIDLKQPRGGAGEAVLTATLDEAARARKGLSFGAQLTGPVAVRAVAPLGRPGPVRVEIDLARAAVENLLPGWTKPAGKPGRATFLVGMGQEGGPAGAPAGQTAELSDLVVESGSVLLKGSAVLGADGQLERADLPVVRLSPGDDMRARVERAGNVLKVSVRGNNADARPVLKMLTSNQAAQGGAAQREAREVELDFAVNILTGHHGEAVTGASVKALLRQREARQVQFGGRLGRAQLRGQTQRQERTPVLVVESDDAGATLRFLDVYKRMVGGALIFQATLGEGPQNGNIVVSSFRLRNEPALGQIIAEQPGAVGRAAMSPELDPGDVGFTRLKASFTKNAGRLDVQDAVIWGPLMGFSLAGFIDYPRDRTDIQGTFVPIYGLNNVFAQLPVLGPLLGGGQNEGLFAINFRLSGPASSPTLSVNPLSAIAPGFLRRLFGAAAAEDGPPPPPPPPLPDR